MTCPTCKSKRAPLPEARPDEIVVCPYCGAALLCEASVSMRRLMGADFEQLTEEQRQTIARQQDSAALPVERDAYALDVAADLRSCRFCDEPLPSYGRGRPRVVCDSDECMEARALLRAAQKRAERMSQAMGAP